MAENPKEKIVPIYEITLVCGKSIHVRNIKFEGSWLILMEPYIENQYTFVNNQGDFVLIPISQVKSLYKANSGISYEPFEKINIALNYGTQDGLNKVMKNPLK